MNQHQKRKQGFTLVELLAVIVILAVILVIAIPNIIKIIDKSKIDAYGNQMELIKNAASKYIIQYSDEVSDPTNATVLLSKLQEKNLIGSNIKNPITNQLFGDIAITIKKTNNVMTYGVSEVPELVTGMIPVTYDGTYWVKADITNPNNSWYDYSAQKWANAVTVLASGFQTRSNWQGAAVGTIIPIEDINTMFVWIPRYKYLIPAGSGTREIDTIFETKYISKSSGDAVSTYYTHPAFTFGTTELNGIWVGKFETTGTITNGTTASLTIKPDTLSVSSQTVKTFYDAIKNTMQGTSSTPNAKYGFTNDNDTHMIKNTEWGAVAYLSNSRYGKYGNNSYSGNNKEIYLNNSSMFYTGRSMGTYGGGTAPFIDMMNQYGPSGTYTYDGKCAIINSSLPSPCNIGSIGQTLTDKKLAYGASSSGTIYGIYDMSGGAYDYTMGIYKPDPLSVPSGISDNSGFSTANTNSTYTLLPNSKYYNQYLTNIVTGCIKGDATCETSGWNNDTNNYATTTSPWMSRGNSYDAGAAAGIFNSYPYGGGSLYFFSVRTVLVPGS